MNKLIVILTTLFLLAIPVSAEIEQHEGFPVNMGYRFYSNIVVQDIDRDGLHEIIATPENRMVKVFTHNGTLKWENTGGVSMHDYARVPIVLNLSGDNKFEVLSYGNPGYSDPTFYLWDASGNKQKEIMVGKYLLLSPPAVTRDGIIFTGAAPGKAFDAIVQASGVHAFDLQGNISWYLELGNSVNFQTPSIPLSDLDGDGTDEAVILTHDITQAYPTDGKVHVIKVGKDSGSVLWSHDLGGNTLSAAIGNLGGDSANEIVVLSSTGVYIFDKNGNVLHHFNINYPNLDNPVIGDLDGDGVNEVVIASSRDKRIYIISNGTLTSFSSIGRVTSNLAIDDVNGDGFLEILAGDLYKSMYLWDYNGNVLEHKRFTGDEFFTSVAIADLENDGDKELILGNFNGKIYVYTYIRQVDITPPVTTDDVDGEWYNSNVTVILTAKDEEGEGVAATYFTIDGSVPTTGSISGNSITLSKGGIYTVKYFSVDNAGNSEPVKTAANTVKIDKAYPVTTDDCDEKWHNTSVVVTLVPFDNGSGIKNTYYTTDGSLPTESSQNGTVIPVSNEGDNIVKYYSVDNAGNAEPVRENFVRIDTTSPFSSDDSDGGWHNTDVTLNLNSNDTHSGIESLYYIVDGNAGLSYSNSATLTLSSEGVHQIGYYGRDNAGNTESGKSTIVKIDKTPPVTTDDTDGEWHNSDILVTLTASDDIAGTKSTYYSIVPETETLLGSLFTWISSSLGISGSVEYTGNNVPVSGEGVFKIQYYSIDNANNEESGKTSKQVKIDKTLPSITVNVPLETTYLHSDIITFDFNAVDSFSGIKSIDALIDNNLTVYDGNEFDMLDMEPGNHSLEIVAMDNANNPESIFVRFNVIINIESLTALTERGAINGWINDSKNINNLLTKLESAQKKIDNDQVKGAINILTEYMDNINAQTGKTITPEGGDILKSDAMYLIDTLNNSLVLTSKK